MQAYRMIARESKSSLIYISPSFCVGAMSGVGGPSLIEISQLLVVQTRDITSIIEDLQARNESIQLLRDLNLSRPKESVQQVVPGHAIGFHKCLSDLVDIQCPQGSGGGLVGRWASRIS